MNQYLPFWFVPMISELEKSESDVYQLMQRLGKKPYRCTETVDAVQVSRIERLMFEMSPDDPRAPLSHR